MSIVDNALAAADLGLRVIPVLPQSKLPAIKGWPTLATTDHNTILSWFAAEPNANYGIATGNDLFVVDLDGPDAASWWDTQGFEQGATVTTPSGGRHVYYWAENDIQTNQSKVFKGIDVRGTGGYVVGPGSVTDKGTYAGDLSTIQFARENLLAVIPERPTNIDREPSAATFEVAEFATDSEKRQLGAISRNLKSLPSSWSAGCGWHDTVFNNACHLSRLANTPAYMVTGEEAFNLLAEKTPVYPGWGYDKVVTVWKSAREATKDEVAEAPTPNPVLIEVKPDFPDFLSTSNLLPMYTSRGNPFSDLLFTEPEVVTATTISDARATLLHEIFRAGLTESQAATLAYHANVGAPLQQAPDGITQLWAEVATAKAFVAAQALQATTDGQTAPAPTADPRERAPKTQDRERRISFLTEAEREYVLESGECSWHGTRYMDWAASRSKAFNAPYHRFNRWTPLSLKFGPTVLIPLGEGDMGLNFFQITLGKTTTGKTAGQKLQKEYLTACFRPGENPNIGGDASPNALVEALIGRDGLPSLAFIDEAHGIFQEINAQGSWRTGLRDKWTDLYEGQVPVIQRKGAKELSGVEATTHFNMFMMSTIDGMSKAIDAEYWTSGFLARFVWTIGEDIEQSPQTRALNWRRGPKAKAAMSVPKQWASEHDHSIRKVGATDATIAELDISDEADQRHDEFIEALYRQSKGHRNEDRLLPTSIRFHYNILKCAALVAVSESCRRIELRHILIAIEQAEEWWANIVFMAHITDDTNFSRSVNAMEALISKQHGREMRKVEIYKHGPGENRRIKDDLIAELVAQQRVKEMGVMVICNDEGA